MFLNFFLFFWKVLVDNCLMLMFLEPGVQRYCVLVSKWFKANKLSLNVSKTKWSLFHPERKKRYIAKELPNLNR